MNGTQMAANSESSSALSSDFLVVELAQPDDFDGFRQASRVLLALNAEPHAVRWRFCQPLARQMQEQDLFAADEAGSVVGRALTPDELDQLPLPPAQPLRLG